MFTERNLQRLHYIPRDEFMRHPVSLAVAAMDTSILTQAQVSADEKEVLNSLKVQGCANFVTAT